MTYTRGYIQRGNPVGIKTAMEILGFCSNEVRLPLHEMSIDNYKSLERTLKGILGQFDENSMTQVKE